MDRAKPLCLSRIEATTPSGGRGTLKRQPIASLVIVAVVVWVGPLSASNVPVRYKEGLTHGFLVLSTTDGTPLAEGDLTEVVRGNVVTTHLTYHFKDGSLQEEVTRFSQKRTFRLISYRLIQKGPSFKDQVDLSVVTSKEEVTVHSIDDKGKEKVETEHMKLPSDLSNGMILTLLKNVRPDEPLPQLTMLVATPKPRIVKLMPTFQEKEPFSIAGSKREALHYVIKIEIGGIAGLVAPFIGKQPPDAHVWIIGGEAPTFVKSITVSYMGGPLWMTELASPVWPDSPSAEPKISTPSKQ